MVGHPAGEDEPYSDGSMHLAREGNGYGNKRDCLACVLVRWPIVRRRPATEPASLGSPHRKTGPHANSRTPEGSLDINLERQDHGKWPIPCRGSRPCRSRANDP